MAKDDSSSFQSHSSAESMAGADLSELQLATKKSKGKSRISFVRAGSASQQPLKMQLQQMMKEIVEVSKNTEHTPISFT